MMKNTAYKEVENYKSSSSYDLEGPAKDLIKDAEEKNIPIENDVKTLKNQIDMDLRDNIPTQIYSVVSGIIGLITKLEEVDNDES